MIMHELFCRYIQGLDLYWNHFKEMHPKHLSLSLEMYVFKYIYLYISINIYIYTYIYI